MLRSSLRNILHLYAGICELFVNLGRRIISADVMRLYKRHYTLLIRMLFKNSSIENVYIIWNPVPSHLEYCSG